jgi:two-component system, LuxR family, sensor kinase FixL
VSARTPTPALADAAGAPHLSWLDRVFSPPALAAAALSAGYFLGSLVGLSWQFPGTQISVIWPPNAILLAALLVSPRRLWAWLVLGVVPAHFLAQLLMGLPLSAVLVNLVGNLGDALLGALAIDYFMTGSRRYDRLRPLALIMLFGGIVAPSLMSLVVAELFSRLGMSGDPWLAWRLRLLTNTLAVFTIVPPIVVTVNRLRTPKAERMPRRSGEAGALLTGLLVSGALLFGLPTSGAGDSPVLLCLPLPFLLWAAMRFGLSGVSLSVLTLAGVSMWGASQGYGPFSALEPMENATSLVLFLNVTCAPLLMLAALLEERRSLDEERRQVANLHSAVLASVHDQIAVLDREGVILEVNEAWSAAGRPAAGASYLAGLRQAAHNLDETAVRMLAGVEAVLGGRRRRFQTEYALSIADGSWFELSAEGLKRAQGGAVITHTEITSRKKAELETRQQRQELAHLTRVSMLGELSGALAHELNQPLTAILSNAQAAQRMLAREPVDLAEVREILRDIADDDRRAGDVIQRLRAMLKKGEAQVVALDLNEVVQEVLEIAHGDLITRNISVSRQLAPWLPPVRADRVQMQQVLLNLILNACEAMTANRADDRSLTVFSARDHESSVRAAIIDSGPGIPADDLERVFEPFFTTKANGLGLGLSICRSIVVAHGGRLWASNNEMRGATFYVTLPLQSQYPS